MIYTTYNDLAKTIRLNLWKVPQDIDLIVGVPRSGMLPAIMLAEIMNKQVTDLDSFLQGNILSCGYRGNMIKPYLASKVLKVLVIDDTVFNGASMDNVKNRLLELSNRYEILYACVYAEGEKAKEFVDIYLEDAYNPKEDFCHLYEWNILQHYPDVMSHYMFDMDSVLCKEPPDERDVAAYEKYIADAIPMVVPSSEVGAIVTYRLEKYRGVTEEWLRRYGIQYRELIMAKEGERSAEDSAAKKAEIYRNAEWAKVFVESSLHQAQMIHRLSGKPVYCYENGIML